MTIKDLKKMFSMVGKEELKKINICQNYEVIKEYKSYFDFESDYSNNDYEIAEKGSLIMFDDSFDIWVK